ncbi:RagB/SusD family nutrient uptake outer membrane protein [Paraflavitalea speifideaquila]|uniref:RagB/SusD family nutrient uptake outer membrane protein n=1 Tax=Paraflavitalea speifideaquila TaxID=3076558 RepID=UPI0028ECD630|nr:RagB/SusD family nutrient uptake outer membrane protein [Paraflavitalea speifideiaquila]
MKATITAIYNGLQATGYYGRDYIAATEVLTDNGEITTSNSNRFVAQGRNTPGSHVGIFNAAYSNIFRANFVLKYVDGTEASDADRARLKGNAYFLRGLCYFDLVKNYARNPAFIVNGFDLGVPIVTDAILDVYKIEYPSRAKVGAVYTQIINDLKQAITLLDDAEAPKRASKTSSQALLSRVSLYNGNWDDAEKYATDALATKVATFAADSSSYLTKWGNGYPEMILGLGYESYESLGTDCIQGIFFRYNGITGYGDITARAELLNDYYTNDRRRKNLIAIQTKGTQTVNYTLKYPNEKKVFGTDDIMLLRISELYLNRAEARARKAAADEVGAMDDLNKIHVRAGLAPLAVLTGQSLVDAIWRERRLEFAFEGHRLYDLLRTGKNLVKGTTTINWDDYKLIAPIPTTELDTNPNLKPNNPGY